jgi:gamma-glutamyltranspeptidase/glutathione hydrolase
MIRMPARRPQAALALLAASALSATALALPAVALAASHPPARATKGMVSADNTMASQAGAEMLRRGGDAADAAVATALMLGVVQPFASGIGGGGFAVVWRADAKQAYALDFREVAPAAATADMYLDADGNVIPKASTRGPKAAGVPGELRGLHALHQRHGTLPWPTVVEPALRAARDGFPAGQLLVKRIRSKQQDLKARPALAKVWLPDGKVPAIGQLMKHPDLARTLEAVARDGADAFYTGDVARRLAAAMKADGGLITEADLSGYAPKERPLVAATWRGFRILSMPPPSSGGAVIVQVLRVLEDTDLAALGHNSSAYLHRLTEALKHAFADRARVMGDPDFTPVPIDALVGDDAIARVRGAFRPDATLERAAYGGDFGIPEDGGTSHFNVVDADGDAIALTTTINLSFGSMYIAGDTGVLMNDEMDDFVAKPGVPNAFGLVGRAANAIAPGKRPLSSMSPTLVLKDDRVVLAAGASGGPTIITGTLQVLLNVLVFEMNPRQAVEAPRIHHQWVPEAMIIEPEIPLDVHEALRRRGHALRPMRRFNSVQAIRVSAEGQTGASDPSKMGAPAGTDVIDAAPPK